MTERFEYVEPKALPITISDPIDRIAFIAHNCYKVSAKDHLSNFAFVSRLVRDGHLAMVEHYRFHLSCSTFALNDLRHFNSPFIVYDIYRGRMVVSFSLRVVIENASVSEPHARKVISTLVEALPEEVRPLVSSASSLASPYDPKLITEEDVWKLPEKLRERHSWFSYMLTTDRGVTHELVRHRLCSFAQESTRYCNYSRDRFQNRIAVIKPLDYDQPGRAEVYDRAFQLSGEEYFQLLELGAKPQEARAVLPNGLKADLCISASLAEWRHILELRLAPSAHPECRRVLLLVAQDMIDKGILTKEEIESMKGVKDGSR